VRILLTVAALAACSPPSVPGEVPSSGPATETAATQRPGQVRIFGNWAVGCDNIALCTMTTLGPESGAGPPELIVTLLRQPGGEGQVDLSFQAPGDDKPITPAALAIDGRVARLDARSGPAALRIATAMARGATLDVRAATPARISLNGASAALRWIDEQQGRVGTVTAIVARGTRPPSNVLPIGNPPTVRAVVPAGRPVSPTARQLAAMNRFAACEMPDGVDASPTLVALGAGRTLVILPCSAGAYNVIAALFVLDTKGFAPAEVDSLSDGAEAVPDSPAPTLINAEWRQGELTSYAKGRGLGDCGVREVLVWDGSRLRLTEQSVMPECRGNPHFLPTWRAQVVRG
jgi:hypothetical protein